MSSWTDPGWVAQAHRWIEGELSHLGLDAIGAIEQPHVYPWSTVMRISTARGDVYFKANSRELRHEAALVELLSGRRPDCVPALLALERDRGWMLMADGGTRLRELVASERQLERWLDVLPLYAGVQIDLVGRVDEMLALGVPDLRLQGLPDRYEQLLAGLAAGAPADIRAVRELTPRVAEMCHALAGYGLPETIQHDDFHDGQVYVRDGGYRLLDWGDACISHPFFTLSVTLEGGIAWGVDDVQGSVDVSPFRDAYLRPFAAFGEAAELEAACVIALRLGWICRAVNGHVAGDSDKTLRRLRMFLAGRPNG